MQQGPEIKTSPANHNRKRAAGADFLDDLSSSSRVFSGSRVASRINNIEQMMRSAGLFFRSGLGRADAEFAIERDRVAVHDLAVEAGSEFQRERSLTATCWPKNYNQQRIARQSAHAPMNVMPIARKRNRKDENGNHDHASSF